MTEFTDVSEIVDSCVNIDGYEKDLLRKLFQNLESKQEELFEKIGKKVEETLNLSRMCSSGWHIYTALIDNDKTSLECAKQNRFFEIVPTIDSNCETMSFQDLNVYAEDDPDIQKRGNVYAGVLFLNCRCSGINELKHEYTCMVSTENDTFEAQYQLLTYEAFLEEEKLLEQAALQYNISEPLIYSPMSRRAVVVKVFLEPGFVRKNMNGNIDFQFEKNGLAQKVYTGKTLVWNVRTADQVDLPNPKDNTEKTVEALFDKTYVIYSFDANDNDFYYIRSHNHDVRRIGHSVYVGIDREVRIDDIAYKRFTIEPVNEYYLKDKLWFNNRFHAENILKKRVRTKGDVLNVLSGFELKPQEILFKPGNALICTYEKRFRYHYPTDDVLKSSSFIYLKMENSDDLYYEDYISYVLAFLNYYYPEFRWVGVK